MGLGSKRVLGGVLVVAAMVAAPPTVWVGRAAASGAGPSPAFYTYQSPGGQGTLGKKVIALTFDDGPGPYTPQVLSVLEQYQVPATFFEIGENTLSYPQYTEELAAAGYPVEDHTWSHPDLATLPVSEFPYQIDQTQSRIAALTGTPPACVRPPYNDSDATVLDQIGNRGLTTMEYSIDPKDWSLPGTQAIVSRVVGAAFPGAVVDLHDAGGDRHETVDALPQIITSLRSEGYSFVFICDPNPPPPFEVAFQANDGTLWSAAGSSWADWNVGLAPGTSPSMVRLGFGRYEIAFQAYGGALWTVGNAGWTNWDVGMAPGTSPSMVRLSNGGYEIAFQASGGDLWTIGTAGWTDWHAGVAPGTSPSLVALPDGGFEAAFQADGGALRSVGTGGTANWDVGMAPDTSPSAYAPASGGYEIAFQASGGALWSVGSAGWTNWGVGMAPGTSPATVRLSDGGYEIGFQAFGGRLWSVGSAGWTDWGVGMAPASSPSVAALTGGGFEVAFEAYGGDLWTVGSAGWTDWPLGMASAASPAAS